MKFSLQDSLLIFGRSYSIEIAEQEFGVKIVGERVVVGGRDATANQKINNLLKRLATHYILPRTQQLTATMGVQYNKITLRQQSSRWGSCSSKGNLNFNWRLAHCPPEVIDYVIIHELAHLTEMNHSSRFWAIVRKFDPDFPTHRGWLRRFERSAAKSSQAW